MHHSPDVDLAPCCTVWPTHLTSTSPPCCTVWPTTTLDTPSLDSSRATSSQARWGAPRDKARLHTGPSPPSRAAAVAVQHSRCHQAIYCVKTIDGQSAAVQCMASAVHGPVVPPAKDDPEALAGGQDLPEHSLMPALTTAFHARTYCLGWNAKPPAGSSA